MCCCLPAGKSLPAEAQVNLSVTRQRQRWITGLRTDRNQSGNYNWAGDWWCDRADRRQTGQSVISPVKTPVGTVMWHKHGKKTWRLFWNDANNTSILQRKNKSFTAKIILSNLVAADYTYVLPQPVFLYLSFKVFPNIIPISSFRDAYGLICHWDASTSEYFIDSNVGHPSLSHPAQSFVTWDRYF